MVFARCLLGLCSVLVRFLLSFCQVFASKNLGRLSNNNGNGTATGREVIRGGVYCNVGFWAVGGDYRGGNSQQPETSRTVNSQPEPETSRTVNQNSQLEDLRIAMTS